MTHQLNSDISVKQTMTKMIFIFIFLLHFFWVIAWLFQIFLESNTGLLASQNSLHFYWFSAKIILWFIPSLLIIHYSKNNLKELMGFKKTKETLMWGILGGLIFVILALLPKLLSGSPIFSFNLNYTFFAAVIVAPIVEELTFRGTILPILSKRYGFWIGNTLTALFFTTIHMPGWYFQGKLIYMLTSLAGGALFIFFIAWVLGWIAHKSKSVGASTLAHMMNNLFNL